MSKDKSLYNAVSGQAVIFSQIITFVIIIIVLLLTLLWAINRDRLDELDSRLNTDTQEIRVTQEIQDPPEIIEKKSADAENKNAAELIDETNKMINNVTERITIYSIKDDREALEEFNKIIDILTQYIKGNPLEDINPVLARLNEMADALLHFVETRALKNANYEKRELIKKIENLKEYLKNYPVKDVELIMIKLSDIIEKLESGIKQHEKPEKIEKPKKTETHKQSGSHTKYIWIPPHKKPQWEKPYYHDWILEHEPEILRFPIGDRITTDEIIEEKLEKKDKIFGKTICLKPNENKRSNSVHMMENQMLIKIISIGRGTASLDISHPTLGLRRFTDMEEGTRRPFEYGTKTYFCELIEIVNKQCANVSVYERQEISGR